MSEDMRRMKSKIVQIALKLISVLFLCTLVLVYINWDSPKTSPEKRLPLKFKVVGGNGYVQIVPFSSNTTRRFIHPQETMNRSQQYDLRILAIVYNRADTLVRLLESLNKAEYYGDRVRLEVWIDRAKNGSVSQDTLRAARSFEFHHGSYAVIPHKQHVGIYGQWLSTWAPVYNSSEIAVILEDDLTVSPLFYKYLKVVHSKYDHNPHINGYSLQGISIKHSGNGYLQAPADSMVFLYPVIGTWGFSPSTENWMKFIGWFSSVYQNQDFKPLVPGNVASLWYEEFISRGRTEGMWSMWHIHFAWKQKEFTLYPNFKGRQGLTSNWKGKGLHYQGTEKSPSNPLLLEWKPENQRMPDTPIMLNTAGNVIQH